MINKNKGLTPLFLYKMIIWLVKKSHENVIFLCSDKNAGSEIKVKNQILPKELSVDYFLV